MIEMLLSLLVTNKLFAFPTLVLPRSGTRVLLSLAVICKAPRCNLKNQM